MNEEEIRLDQTKRVFDVLANLISKNETCTYRYLIYDLLGFEKENYAELISGLEITNVLVEKEKLHSIIKEVREYIEKELKSGRSKDNQWLMGCYDEDKHILEILDKEIKNG